MLCDYNCVCGVYKCELSQILNLILMIQVPLLISLGKYKRISIISKKNFFVQVQFVIFNPWKISWNWIAFSQNSFVISPDLLYTWLDQTLDNLQTRPLRQMLLFFRGLIDKSIAKWNVRRGLFVHGLRANQWIAFILF